MSGTATAGQSSCPVPYTSSGPWNKPISATPTVDPASPSEVATMSTNTPYPMLGSDPTQYTMPVYIVSSQTPRQAVYVASSYSNVTGSTTLVHQTAVQLQIPMPPGTEPASGSDAQTVIWDRDTGEEWGFWQFFNSTDPLSANMAARSGTPGTPIALTRARADYWAGEQVLIGKGRSNAETAVIASFPDADHAILKHATSYAHVAGERVWGFGATNGYHYNTLWSGVPPAGFGSRGAGVPYLAGLVRACEIAQGHIDHALAFGYQNSTSRFVSPATKSDGTASRGMPEGAHLQLDPWLTKAKIESWGCTGACLIAAQAMQKYGMYLIDNAGHPKVYFEYDGTAKWGGTVDGKTTNPIPLSAFRVIDG
jgi:hypothetical protein